MYAAAPRYRHSYAPRPFDHPPITAVSTAPGVIGFTVSSRRAQPYHRLSDCGANA